MGVSTNGQIAYGVLFEEGHEFPWDSDEFEGDIETWWQHVSGYVNPHFCPFDDSGDYKPGVKTGDPRISEYFAHQRQWTEANPIPVELVNVQSADCPMYMLAVRSSVRVCYRGYPEAFDPAELHVTNDEKQALLAFLSQHGIEFDGEPKWYLSSCWG